MQDNIKQRLKAVMQERNVKTPALSEALKIPKDRIYAWYRDNSEPKAEDKSRLEKWIEDPDYRFVENSNTSIQAKRQSSQTESEVIELLKSQIRMLENHCTFVQKMYEDIKNKTDVNLNEALSNQRVMMRQIAVESHLAAQRFAGNDKKKFQAELDKIDKLITAGM